MPIKILEINNPVKFFANANEIVPTSAISKKYITIFFGPYLSSNIPAGICMIENPIKYPPANKPRLPAERSNSPVNTGVRVAVIDLSKFDIKKPNAKTQNIIMLLFTLFIIYIFFEIKSLQ